MVKRLCSYVILMVLTWSVLPYRREEQQAAQHRSNQQQLAHKAAAAEATRQANAAYKQAWSERLVQLKQEELQEAADARQRALQVCIIGSFVVETLCVG